MIMQSNSNGSQTIQYQESDKTTERQFQEVNQQNGARFSNELDEDESQFKMRKKNKGFKIDQASEMMMLDIEHLVKSVHISQSQVKQVQSLIIKKRDPNDLCDKNESEGSIDMEIQDTGINNVQIEREPKFFNDLPQNQNSVKLGLESQSIQKSTNFAINFFKSDIFGQIIEEVEEEGLAVFEQLSKKNKRYTQSSKVLDQNFAQESQQSMIKSVKSNRKNIFYNPIVENCSFDNTFKRGMQSTPTPQISEKIRMIFSGKEGAIKITCLQDLSLLISKNQTISVFQSSSILNSLGQINGILGAFSFDLKVNKFLQLKQKYLFQTLLSFQESLQNHKTEDFRFVANLGKGCFGAVDLYQYEKLSIPIAMKQLKYRESFSHEVYLMEKIQSQYSPKLFFFDIKKLQIYMEVGLCSLEDLRLDLIKKNNKLSDSQALSILTNLLVALEILIQQKCFHSDIKPSNIIFKVKQSESGKEELGLMLIDYGGGSFEVEDYWTCYTPAFVCTPLWNKLTGNINWNGIKSNSVKEKVVSTIEKGEDSSNNNSGANTLYSSQSKTHKVNGSNQENQQSTMDTQHQESQIKNSDKRDFRTNSKKIECKKGIIFEEEEEFHYKNYQKNQTEVRVQQKMEYQQLKKMKSDGFNYDNKANSLNSSGNSAFNTEWIRTQNRENKANSEDWLTWEEIRYAEIYAVVRTVQQLIIKKEDLDYLFQKKNMEKFILKYKNEYPKTIAIFQSILRTKTMKLSKSSVKLLVFGTTEEDFSIQFDMENIFNMSPLKQGIEEYKRNNQNKKQ